MAKDRNIKSYIDASEFPEVFYVNSQDDSSVIHMVNEGLGIAVLSQLSVIVSNDVDCKNLIPPLTRTPGLTYNKKSYENKKEVRNFIKHINENKQELLP